MVKIAIIIGSTRPGRKGAIIARWVNEIAQQRTDASFDYLYHEWNNKAAGFVSYGASGGRLAVENLRLIMGELMIADVRAQVACSLFTDFEHFSAFKPSPHQEALLHTMLDQIISWSCALKTLRHNGNTKGQR